MGEYWNPMLVKKAEYLSPNKSIKGTICEEERVLYIDFTPNNVKKDGAKNFSEIRRAFKLGFPDLLDFIIRINTDSRFDDVDKICGRTNPRMAAFAIKRLWFHPEHYPDLETMNPDGLVGISISKKDLLERLPLIKQEIQKLHCGR